MVSNSIPIIKVHRPNARNCMKRQFRLKHRDHAPSRVRVNKLVLLLSKRKLTERTKSTVKHSFPKSPKIQDSSENYKGFQVNFLRRYDCFFSTYFVNRNLQRFAHSNKFSTYASGGKINFFNARFNFKKCNNHNIGHFTVTQVFSLMKACNCNKNTTINEAKKIILLSEEVELNPGPTLRLKISATNKVHYHH